MVGGTVRRDFLTGNGNKGMKQDREFRDDVDTGTRRNRKTRFRDVVGSVIQDGRRQKMKKKLKEGVDQGNLESFRKSLDEVGESLTPRCSV